MGEELTQGGRMLKRGDMFDPECHRATHRLGRARGILRAMGLAPKFPAHADDCDRAPERLRFVLAGYRDRVPCTCGLGRDPAPEWPPWVTDRTFNLAYALADEEQTQRGRWYRQEINRERREREAI